jgi:hypothetical protein
MRSSAPNIGFRDTKSLSRSLSRSRFDPGVGAEPGIGVEEVVLRVFGVDEVGFGEGGWGVPLGILLSFS